jgi:hypothetical protein
VPGSLQGDGRGESADAGAYDDHIQVVHGSPVDVCIHPSQYFTDCSTMESKIR